MEWNNKRILIFGKGKSGKAAYGRLVEMGAVPVYYDDNDYEGDCMQYSFLQVENETFDCAVLSPAVKPDHPLLAKLKQKGVPMISEIDLGSLFFKGKTIAVTGTNGKTTTVRQIEALLKGAGHKAEAIGNIGVPFCGVREPLEYAVVEMSSFQCWQSVIYTPDYAAVLNISPDHIEWHGNLHDYRQSKIKLLESARNYALNVDDPDLPRIHDKPCYTYSLHQSSANVFVENRIIKAREGRYVYAIAKVDDLPLRGNHNLYNVLCALTLCMASVGYDPSYEQSLLTFKGERMRVQQLTFKRPYVFNDSKGTNTAATIAALRQMVGESVLLLGGWDKGEDYTRLFMQIPAGAFVITFGQAGARIYKEALLFGLRDIVYAPLLSDAVRLAFAQNKDNILFSPACSSFDAYGSYVERGLDFEKEIQKYL